jgi:NADH-quinone oxidoreductase subunit C
METSEIVAAIEKGIPNSVINSSAEACFPFIQIRANDFNAIMSFCMHEQQLRFDFLECLTASDTGQDFEIIYQLVSTTLLHRINIKLSVERHLAKVTSATGFWRAALAYELEAAEMLGIEFEGLKEVRRLLLPDDWHGHPMRKDYVYPEEYQGVEHRRQPLRKEHVRP